MREEMEERLQKMERERDELKEETRALHHARDQSLLQAESDKQQVTLSMAAHVLYTEFPVLSVEGVMLAFYLHSFGKRFNLDSVMLVGGPAGSLSEGDGEGHAV